MRRLLATALLAACTAPDDTGGGERTGFGTVPTDDSGDGDTGTWQPGRLETAPSSAVALSGASPGLSPWFDTGEDIDVPVFDCALVPDEPTAINELDEPRGYHDVVFDTLGNIIGSDGQHLTQSPDPSSRSIWVPNTGDVQGMDWLPDGDLVTISGGAVVRVNPDDGESVIASNVYAYGVVVGPDGMVYVGANTAVLKLDPESGDYDEFVDLPGSSTPRVVNFSPDYSRMYVGTLSSMGLVYAVDLDEDLEPLDEPYVFAEGVGGGYHDGMGVDVCGNVYVNDYNTFSFYRVSPLGDVSLLKAWTWADGGYGHGQEWGSGLSVWRTDSIYIPQPYDGNTVAEIVVGIPSRRFNGGLYEVINAEK
jgi:hypothetical protein